jgi:2-keto-3-deoxy-L-rhamnonate aldolase RhmA
VLKAIDTVIARARRAGVFVGIGAGDDPEQLIDWADRGIQWLTMGGDFSLLIRAATQVATQVREHLRTHEKQA